MPPEIRDPVRVSPTMIDVEWNHPVLGWIAFSASSEDAEQHGRDIYDLAEEMLDAPDP